MAVIGVKWSLRPNGHPTGLWPTSAHLYKKVATQGEQVFQRPWSEHHLEDASFLQFGRLCLSCGGGFGPETADRRHFDASRLPVSFQKWRHSLHALHGKTDGRHQIRLQVNQTKNCWFFFLFDWKICRSLDRNTPLSFRLGAGQVIKGWDQGLTDMCVGESRVLTIPPSLAYGNRGAGGVIPPGTLEAVEFSWIFLLTKCVVSSGATLQFDVTLVDIRS